MVRDELYGFIRSYSGVAILTNDKDVVVYHNSTAINCHFYDPPIMGKNLSSIFISKSKSLGPLEYAQALNCQEIDRLCWLSRQNIVGTEYFEKKLYTTIRMIVNLDGDYHLLLLIDSAITI